MSELDMRARKFYLSRSLSLRESRALEQLLKAHPAFDHINHNPTYSRFTVYMKDPSAWVAAGMNILSRIEQFLNGCNITYEPSLVPMRQAA